MGKSYKRTGMEIIWANELNPAACKTYRKNFGDYIMEGDICEQIENLPPSADNLRFLIGVRHEIEHQMTDKIMG